MVKGKTKSGIEFKIDERIKGDTRLLQYIVEMQSDDTQTQTTALFDMLGLMFGGRKGVVNFQNAVAANNNGLCSTELLVKELTEIMEALSLKKS